jgi:hypothetical protein
MLGMTRRDALTFARFLVEEIDEDITESSKKARKAFKVAFDPNR